jgi:putative tricarboxylic transport membrane protein
MRRENNTAAADDGSGAKALIAVGLIAGSILALEPLGFLLSSMLFLSAGFIWLGQAKWTIALPAAALASSALWLFFTKLLGVGLPYGLIAEILFR